MCYNISCLGEQITGRFAFSNAVETQYLIVGKAPHISGLTSRCSPRQRRQTNMGRFVMETWYIYALKDPRTNEIRYVGKTVDIEERIRLHLVEARMNRFRRHLIHWLRQLIELGLIPTVEILETGQDNEWGRAERKWIKYYKESGARLTNSTDGGEGSPGHTAEYDRVCISCGASFIAKSPTSKHCDSCCSFICKNCGKVFYTRKYRRSGKPPQYCSSKCYGKQMPLKVKICINCKVEFLSESSFAQYCDNCLTCTCENCGQSFLIKEKGFKKRQRFCCKYCYWEYKKGKLVKRPAPQLVMNLAA